MKKKDTSFNWYRYWIGYGEATAEETLHDVLGKSIRCFNLTETEDSDIGVWIAVWEGENEKEIYHRSFDSDEQYQAWKAKIDGQFL